MFFLLSAMFYRIWTLIYKSINHVLYAVSSYSIGDMPFVLFERWVSESGKMLPKIYPSPVTGMVVVYLSYFLAATSWLILLYVLVFHLKSNGISFWLSFNIHSNTEVVEKNEYTFVGIIQIGNDTKKSSKYFFCEVCLHLLQCRLKHKGNHFPGIW